MKPRKRRPRIKRQNFILQPGGDIYLDSQNQDAAALLLDSGTERGITSSNVQPSVIPIRIDSLVPATQKTQADQSSTEDDIFISTILFAPTSHMDIPMETTGSNAISTTSSAPLNVSSTNEYSSTLPTSDLSLTPGPSSIATSNSSMSINFGLSSTLSEITPSASFNPTANATGRSVGFYSGITFLSIVVVACLFSLAAWFFRSRKKKKKTWSLDDDIDDIENQDPGFGLGIYLDESHTPNNSNREKQADASRTFQSPSDPLAPPPIFQRFADSSREYPAQTLQGTSPGSAQSPVQRLGPLQINNYVSGDLPSSCDEGLSLMPPPPIARSARAGTEYGTPREMLDAPRFLGLDGQGLGTPWAPLNIKKTDPSNQLRDKFTSVNKNLDARTERSDEISQLPPLPMPPFQTISQTSSVETTDSWGSSLRSSIFSALSGLAGGTAKQDEDKFTSLPENRMRSTRRQSAAKRKVEDLDTDPKPYSSLFASWEPPRAMDDKLLSLQNSSGSGFGKSSGTDTELSNKDQQIDELPINSSKEQIGTAHRDSFPDLIDKNLQSVSRESSVYSSVPGALRQVSPGAPKYHLGSKKHSVGSVSRNYGPLKQTRPTFLRQESNKSATSFSSESSETSRDLTDEELRVKRLMMLRARRKRASRANGSSLSKVVA